MAIARPSSSIMKPSSLTENPAENPSAGETPSKAPQIVGESPATKPAVDIPSKDTDETFQCARKSSKPKSQPGKKPNSATKRARDSVSETGDENMKRRSKVTVTDEDYEGDDLMRRITTMEEYRGDGSKRRKITTIEEYEN